MDTTRLICTECGTGNLSHVTGTGWAPVGPSQGYATCTECGQMLSVPLDILPYAEGATLDVDASGLLVAVTA